MGLGIAIVVLLAAVWATANAIKARRDLLMGRSQAEIARGQTSPSNLENGLPITALQRASSEFHRARALLDAPPMFLVRYLPLVGRQVESARALSLAGADAADTTIEALTAAKAELAKHPGTGSGRLQQLRQILAIATAAQRRLSGLHYGPRTGLIGSLADGRNQLSNEIGKLVNSLDRGTAAGRSLTDLLGGDHRVLLLATNNAEMRAGSGMPLQIGVLQFSDGQTHLETLQSTNNFVIPRGAVPPPPDLAARWGWVQPANDFDEVLSSPRFDLTAPTAAKMWAALGQKPVDAVIAVDPVLLAGIVGVTGPVTAGGQTYTGQDIVAEILHDQYAKYHSLSRRQDQLGVLAQAAFARFDAGGWSVPAMFQTLAADAGGRHLMLWSSVAADEAGWVRSGVGGVLTTHSLMVNILNKGRNKLDWFLPTSTTLSVTPKAGVTEVAVTVHMANMTPAAEPDEVIGVNTGVEAELYPGQHLHQGDYLGIVELSAPANARNLSIEGVPQPPVAGPDGPTQVVAAQYIIRQKASLDVKFTFTVPGGSGSMTVEPAARVPVMTWTSGATTWSGDHAKTITW